MRLFADASIPLTPDEPEAREWVLHELSKQEYQQAKPNFIEEFFAWLWEQLANLFADGGFKGSGINPWAIVLLVLLIALIAGLALLGRPRAIARRAIKPRAVFLEDDPRSTTELRNAAEAAATRGDWNLAIAERFRAISRALSDRTLITLRPGTTAQGVAVAAVRVFPSETHELHRAADRFDEVRYLNAAGTRAGYNALRALDERLESSRPNMAELSAVGASTTARTP
ncbi:DUF4129 domain-containing protein [uncultured Gulosibacter sp.]|uniref:DUF4129 domain-containing protein n=1 Tax=uncultured Gulosibacter sp. TaxID=1339167 RepID=UPI00288B2BD3|nr:DUF4129 domain-containing protein [uncultured Gulosibacter sp.]